MANARWNTVPDLRGAHVALEPLRLEHVPALRGALGEGELSRLWYANVPAPDAVERYVAAALDAQARGDALPFVVRDAGGEVVGCTRYYALDAGMPRLNIGYTWYHRRVQRTGLNTEAKLLLLRHAFEAMSCIAIGFETSWFNHASRAAIARLGAKQDGVLRNHKRHADGTPRDTVVFSILDSEWPAVRSHLQSLLDSHS
ncbi:GNAT family N-acetyltransferase [Stenotrophomonas sp. MYb238]|uniref:GNAT family N-acetyltransferase n=1 Tax=Stenotrophomonas sp. MYb238 TaxID=2040281 RepID=UPI0012918988|nr:GNAT family protein [Stenotrophomonas sp. MYb238]MQP77722.1 GNAT family N-acetyltransferase [Stenotrophomonas sp. MYb238]